MAAKILAAEQKIRTYIRTYIRTQRLVGPHVAREVCVEHFAKREVLRDVCARDLRDPFATEEAREMSRTPRVTFANFFMQRTVIIEGHKSH